MAARAPEVPISVDTTSATVAAAALDAGAHLLNDIWGVADDPAMSRLAAERGVPLVVMHNRAEPRYDDVVAEVVADLRGGTRARRGRRACAPERLIVDPGFGFGKTPDHNLALLAGLATLRRRSGGRCCWARPASRPSAGCSTCPWTSASRRRSRRPPSASRSGVDVVRVHDVRENVRVARIADAVVRGWRPAGWTEA